MIAIKKNLATFGFLFLVLLIINSFLFTSTIKTQSSSTILNVPFFEQKNHYYCGPASIQMVITYITGSVPSQDLLAYELEIDHIKNVTYTAKMRIPFDLRNLNQIYTVEGMSISELKLQSAQGFLAILLIWFEEPHKEKNHYVVVVGCNETGVFIHDPWPPSWSKPGRNTGPYVFMSDSELEYLWDCDRYHWALVIPYKPLSSDKTINPVTDPIAVDSQKNISAVQQSDYVILIPLIILTFIILLVLLIKSMKVKQKQQYNSITIVLINRMSS